MISNYVTRQTDILPVEVAERRNHENVTHGVVEFIGRQQYPKLPNHASMIMIERARVMDQMYPDRLEIPFKDDDERDNICMIQIERHNPVVDREFSFSEARAAYEYLQSGQHFGKVVIMVSP